MKATIDNKLHFINLTLLLDYSVTQDARKIATDLKKVKEDIIQWEKTSAEAKKTVSDLQKSNPWILEEKGKAQQ